MSGHKPRRPRWPAIINAMAVAQDRATILDPAEVGQIMRTISTSAQALREGTATLLQWSIVAGAIDLAHAIERQGVVRGMHEHFASADAALKSIHTRATQAGPWKPTALHYFEIDAMQAFIMPTHLPAAQTQHGRVPPRSQKRHRGNSGRRQQMHGAKDVDTVGVHMSKLKIYVAGPMTGLPDFNFPAFHTASATLRAQGWQVVNPAEINPDSSLAWTECMRRDIAELVTCDAIHLLDGWWASKGATLEHHIAERLGMQVYEGRAATDWAAA